MRTRFSTSIDIAAAPDRARALSIAYAGSLGPVVAWLTLGINDRYLGLEAAGLKRRSEGR
jgi:hypothetical protein